MKVLQVAAWVALFSLLRHHHHCENDLTKIQIKNTARSIQLAGENGAHLMILEGKVNKLAKAIDDSASPRPARSELCD